MEQNNKAPQNLQRRQNSVSRNDVKKAPVQKMPVQNVRVNRNAVRKKVTPTENKISEQQKNQQNAPVKLTREERARIIRGERIKRSQQKKARIELVKSALVLFAITFLVLLLVFSSIFFISLTAHKSPDLDDYTLNLSTYDNSIEVEKGSIADESGTRFLNFSKIAEFFGFAMVGSIDDMKYVVKGLESETVSFSPGSDKAYVNDVLVRTEAPAFYKNGDLYVCESFVERYILGFNIKKDTGKKTVNLGKILLNPVNAEGEIADGKDPSYEEVSFVLKAPVISASIPENDSAVAVPTFEFYSNVSAYEEYMNPGSTTEFLTLVNEENKLSSDYIPTGLSLIKYGDGMYLKEYAAKAFEAMMKEASACGISGLTVSRAYVSYDESLTAYNAVVDEYVNLLGKEQANRYAAATVSVPGTDEHQTGLAVDFALTTSGQFSTSTAFAWLCDNSYKFGFVLRYPINKTDITGHPYSPEQFRFVGRYHAVRMNALSLTLDEYSEYLGL